MAAPAEGGVPIPFAPVMRRKHELRIIRIVWPAFWFRAYGTGQTQAHCLFGKDAGGSTQPSERNGLALVYERCAGCDQMKGRCVGCSMFLLNTGSVCVPMS